MLRANACVCPVTEAEPTDEPVVVGRTEWIELHNAESRNRVEVRAKVDTGADSSSIDTALAQQLGFDLTKAEKIIVRSALGREERPVINLRMRVGGRRIETCVMVNDRSNLDHPALLGARDLQGFLIDTTSEKLTTPRGSSALVIPPDGLPGPDKNRAGHIFGIFTRSTKMQPAVAINWRDVPPIEHAKGDVIALPCLLNELGFGCTAVDVTLLKSDIQLLQQPYIVDIGAHQGVSILKRPNITGECDMCYDTYTTGVRRSASSLKR